MRIRQIVKRRLMSVSSGSTSESAETSTGSRAIPQIGHEPGRSLTTSGCMGQVYLAPAAGAAGDPAVDAGRPGRSAFGARYRCGSWRNFSRQ